MKNFKNFKTAAVELFNVTPNQYNNRKGFYPLTDDTGVIYLSQEETSKIETQSLDGDIYTITPKDNSKSHAQFLEIIRSSTFEEKVIKNVRVRAGRGSFVKAVESTKQVDGVAYEGRYELADIEGNTLTYLRCE